jgi:DNA-binding SARP family transcriptional activator
MVQAEETSGRVVAVLGRLGVAPLVKLSLSGRRVLAYLVVRGRPTPRGVIAAALWPDMLDEAARANLRRALWRMPRGWVVALGDELLVDAKSDLQQAQAAAARALAGEPLAYPEIELLSQELLPGWHEEWALGPQDAFHLLRVQALEAACRSLGAAGEYALATQAGAAALAAEPLRESAAEALISVHLAQRNRYQAVQCFRDLASRLDRELGVAPDPLLAQRVLDGGLPGTVFH